MRKNYLIYFVLLLCGFGIGNLYGQVSETEKQALLELYNAANGPNWSSENDGDLSNDWNFSGPVTSNWYGLTVDGSVREINIVDNNQSGIIPNVWENFAGLEQLTLSNLILDSFTADSYLWNVTLQNIELDGIIDFELGTTVTVENVFQRAGCAINNYSSIVGHNFIVNGTLANNGDIFAPITSNYGQINNYGNIETIDVTAILDLNNYGGIINIYNHGTSTINNIGDISNFSNNGGHSTFYELETITNFSSNSGSLSFEAVNGFGNIDYFKVNNTTLNILPDFNNETLSVFDIENCYLGYASLEVQFNQLQQNASTFVYTPLKTTISGVNTILEGDTLTIGVTVSGGNNQYTWYKNGVELTTATNSDTFSVTNVQSNDAASYYCIITNTGIPGGQIISDTLTVAVTPNDTNDDNNPTNPGTEEETGWNTITVWEYDANTVLRGNAKQYYDDLGRLNQSQTWDPITGNIWGSMVLYDYSGRPAIQTLSAPLANRTSFLYKEDFITTGGNIYSAANFEGETKKYSPDTVDPNSDLGAQYSDLNTDNIYNDITQYPYNRTIYSNLNPGKTIANLGGNKVDTNKDGVVDESDNWVQSYTFTMPASEELSHNIAFGDPTYKNIKTLKTVTRDSHGVENVVFTDADGKTLAAARSGGPNSRRNTIAFNEQKYIDIHLPEGVPVFNLTQVENHPVSESDYTIYDLIKDEEYTADSTTFPQVPGLGNIEPGFYRIQLHDNVTDWFFYYVEYYDNYYDYSLNEYDDAGRLTHTYQPLGETKAEKPVTTYEYNTLGQLVSTTSVDEGTAKFKYRKDGQIRFSQNTVQAENGLVSFTDYDDKGRPVQSGVITADFAGLDPDTPNFMIPYDPVSTFTDLDDHTITVYDSRRHEDSFFEGNLDYIEAFQAGNVAVTSNKNGYTVYSYDVYGRVTWVVQKINGLGSGIASRKTIDYVYDDLTGLVDKVIYQKQKEDQFIHKYSYNLKGQLVKVETSINNVNYINQAQYFYDEAGTLVRTELADGAQGLDYVYNLAGQLKSINHPSLNPNNDPRRTGVGTTTTDNDLFGMQIDYHTGDYNRVANSNIATTTYGADQLNGNIKGIRWQTKSPIENLTHEYVYTYDRNNWLTAADFDPSGQAVNTGSLPPAGESAATYISGQTDDLAATQSFTLKPGFHAQEGSTITIRIDPNGGGIMEGDYDVSNITYDANGNIQTLVRNGQGAMDNLEYNYDPNKPNQLKQVVDNVGSAPNADDIGTQSAPDNYIYNSIGQLIENKEENITYFYNASGLVTEVRQNNTPMVKFFYNDRNHRVKKEDYTGNSMQTTYYVRDVAGQVMAIYSDYGGSMALAEQPIYGTGRIGVAYNGTNNAKQYVYELTDHLGNVRAVFTKENGNASLEGYTDYYPFGMAMPGRKIVGDYRYAFQGQEKDPETGKEAFQLRLWDSRIGRWLAPDPYGQYNSPYLGMGNNPISGVDFDGGRVYVYKKGLGYFEYKNGNLYNKNGDVYSGNDSFLLETRNSLKDLEYSASIIAIDEGGNISRKGIINDLVNSDDVYRITYEQGSHHTIGANIKIDPNESVSYTTEKGYGRQPYTAVLAHELGHAFSGHNEIKNTNAWFTVQTDRGPVTKNYDENFASNFENLFRGKLGFPLRTHYESFGQPDSRIFLPHGLFFHKSIPTMQTRGIVEVGELKMYAPILD
ncbi:RHS repeat-associated core domain-containing protein [Croceivirga radicis]|uniref:RHS repeat-associated core domain-containing protein n=1 Tax=Croceivirga radicis TaxID=1929488 RepID=UPI000255B313|nr:RHS repeat-associated core domain-containing protein [Croceivirga radicis]